ncbi:MULTISPECIES: cytochrome c-type biogenesis protein [Alcaligenaceae]|uniref:Cytochrome c-type biogenesis protein n=2 Tax=Alcaligenaceae TaxID=506 RepID=A0A366H587_9BURK|nr:MULTISPECIES: cytochrome c-type biogenesis protein [Alcaligenaceae]AWB33996.1 cytochrome c-type biogenesis protein CcmH [Orrella marina]MCI2810699.1 cytochrome c-type biogenesis protein CcmH [Eoetvoesiella caeni]NYT55709.1 cytochrome c-type biogenesis protein CcmH [Eoetvoesiella caeni]RBP36516.1 cytochrome c-type biogenesis protein CcmH [Eoetvoesiella caeni]
MKRWWLILLCAVISAPVWAADRAAEERMLNIASELRCLVCQNESIAASRADLAVDLRQQIREQIHAGQTDQEIRAYMVDRYGDFILYRPPLQATTILLWFGPLLLLVFGLLVLTLTLRHRMRSMTDRLLSDEERKRAEALLKLNNIPD